MPKPSFASEMRRNRAKKKGLSKKGRKVMHEFGAGKLHSGSKRGPVVTDPKQAYAIAKSEERRAKKKK